MDQSTYNRLTERERDCLRLFERHSAKQVAKLLRIGSEKTVETHLRRGRDKLRAGSPQEAAYALIDYERQLSGQPLTVPPRQDVGPPVFHVELAEREPTAVHEERATFDHSTPVSPEPWWSKYAGAVRNDLSRLPRLTLVVWIALGSVLLMIIAVQYGEAIQRLANLLRPTRH